MRVDEIALVPGHPAEDTATVVPVQNIGLAVLDDSSGWIKAESAHQVGLGHRAFVDGGDDRSCPFALEAEAGVGFIAQRGAPVIGHVEVEVAVPVDVGQGDRHGTRGPVQPGLLGGIPKLAVSVINEESSAGADRVDH